MVFGFRCLDCGWCRRHDMTSSADEWLYEPAWAVSFHAMENGKHRISSGDGVVRDDAPLVTPEEYAIGRAWSLGYALGRKKALDRVRNLVRDLE